MATSTIQDQVRSLIERRLAEARSRGAPSPDVEATSVFETVAINLITNPRVALYVSLLARNSLLSVIDNEISAIETLKTTIDDLANISYPIKDTQDLVKARNSLIEIEDQSKVDSESVPFKKFSGAISDFLNKDIKKNIVRPGSTAMMRPGQEAKIDMASDFSALKDIHTDLLDRLYALSVSIPNFLATPLPAIIGVSTANRIRQDIEAIIESIEADPSASQSRDYVTRLIAARATLKTLGLSPSIGDPIIDTASKLPSGYELIGTSIETKAATRSSAGPFTLPSISGLTVQVGTSTISQATFPVNGYQLNNQAHVVGTVPNTFSFTASDFLFLRVRASTSVADFVSVNNVYGGVESGWYQSATLNGVSVGLGDHWLIDEDGRYYKQFKVSLNGVTNVAGLLTAVQTGLGSFVGTALEFPKAGAGQFIAIVYNTYFDKVSVDNTFSEFVTTTIISPPLTIETRVFRTSSAYQALGFISGQSGEAGTTSLDVVTAALNSFFSTIISAAPEIDEFGARVIAIKSAQGYPGISITVSGTAAAPIGIAGTFEAETNIVTLSGLVNGVSVNPANPIPIISVGDILTCSSGTSVISALSSTSVTLQNPLVTFSGAITVTSALQSTWDAFNIVLQNAVDDWLKTVYRADLKKVDASLSVLAGSATAAQRNSAKGILNDLLSKVTALRSELSATNTILPPFSAAQDREVFTSIVNTFVERKFDRALDFFLKGKIQEMFELTFETASYAGAMMKAASAVASTDINFPNRALDEGLGPKAILSRGRNS